MVVQSVAAFDPPSLPDQIGTAFPRKSAALFRIEKQKLPPLEDYRKACAALISRTFPAQSQNAVCDRAEVETGIASADTFARILAGHTKHPDGHLMQCVMVVAASRGVTIPAAIAIRGAL